MLYHSDFKDIYNKKIKNLNPNDNELILFSKNKLLGTEKVTDKHVRGTYGDLI